MITINKNNFGFSVVELVIVFLIAVVLISIGGYEYNRHHQKLDSTQIINQLKTSYVTKHYLTLNSPITRGSGGSVIYKTSGSQVLSNVPAKDYINFSDPVYPSGDNHSSLINRQVDQIEQLLTSNGFARDSNSPISYVWPNNNFPGNHGINKDIYYVSSKEVCAIQLYYGVYTTYIHDTSTIEMDCADISSFTSVAVNALPFNQAYQQYIKTNGNRDGLYENNMAFGNVTIKSSGDGNYKYAEVTMASPNMISGDDYIGYFYTDKTGSNWNFYTGSQQGIQCGQLSSTDEKSALSSICSNEAP